MASCRDRLLTALRHEEPDRVPIDLGATPVTGINVSTYAELRKILGLAVKPVRVSDFGQQLAEVESDVLELLHVDVISVNRALDPAPPWISAETRWRVWTYREMLLGETVEEIPEDIEIVKREDGYYAYSRGNQAAGVSILMVVSESTLVISKA